ncbi:MAG: hypothetical protein K2J82_05570 [Muribaculaceae bacterium]|nr:hypothetical protein [Muribaculaceae bacterium]
MEKKSKVMSNDLLDEAAQLKIYGGTSPMDTDLTINIGSGCKKDRWSDCKKICPIIVNPPQIQ